MRIEKIGGDDSFRMGTTLAMIRDRETLGQRAVYVFSAFKNSTKWSEFNTTGCLISAAESLAGGDVDSTFARLGELRAFYLRVIEREFAADAAISADLATFCNREFDAVESVIHAHVASSNKAPTKDNDYAVSADGQTLSLLGLWEIITTKLYHRALLGSGFAETETEPLPLRSAHEIYEGIGVRVAGLLEHHTTVLVPGYAGGLRGGILSVFDRGYSDATASHLYQALAPRLPESVELAIKKLFVVCSADPRVVGTDRMRIVRALSLRLLLEMIGGRGAEGPFVNRSAVSYGLLAGGGGIRLYSESDPEGSLVTLHGDPESEGVLFVQSKPVSTVTVESYNFEKNGYMERIGDFFGRRWISIDNLVSSETSITVTFNEKSLAGQEVDILLAELRQDLEEFEADRAGAPVSVSRRALSQIHIGGERIESSDLMARISATLASCGIAIETGMQPSHPRVVIVGVAREREHEAVRALHGALVEESAS